MKTKILLIIICFLAFFLRTYKISEVPVSLYWDETAVAYNAYSIFKTGADEFGNRLPIVFRSFNDYKMPGFVYLTAPFVGILGLTEFAVRLPSAISGTVSVAVSFFLVAELVSLGKSSAWLKKKGNKLALLTSFAFAISPWHLQFSRTGFESNVAAMWFVIGFWLFLRFIRTKSGAFLPWLAFIFAFYFYRSIHGFLPFFILILLLTFSKAILSQKLVKQTLVSMAIFTICVVPIIFTVFFSKGIVRFQQVSIFTNSTRTVSVEQIIQNPVEAKVERYQNYSQDFVSNYFAHFSPNFLFLQGDSFARHKIVGMGLMYLIELPLLVLGLFAFRKFSNWQGKALVIAILLLAPIPAAISVPSPHALRDLNVLPIPQLLVSLGVLYIFQVVETVARKLANVLSVALIAIICLAYIFSVYFYLSSYYGPTATQFASIWADGYKQLVQYVTNHEKNYDKVLVSGHYWQPYIYFAFYTKLDPKTFQQFGSSKGFGNYVFGPTGWDEGGNRLELEKTDLKSFAKAKNLLVALSPTEYEAQKNNLRYLTEIKDHNNQTVFIMSETK